MADPVTAGIFIIGTVLSVREQRKSRKAAERASERRQQVQKQRNFRRKRQELRQARAARAQALSRGVAAGAEPSGTSAVQGTRASITSQAASNISFLDELTQAGADITRFENQARRSQGRANLFGSIAGNAQNISTIFEGSDSLFED